MSAVRGGAHAALGAGAHRNERGAYLMLAFVMLLWSGNFILGRAASGLVPPFTLSLIRWAGALLVLAPFAARHLAKDAAELRRSWRIVLALGLSGIAAFNAFIYSGLHYTSASNALLLQAAIPGLVLLLDRGLHCTRPAIAQMAGVLLSTLGVLLIVFRGDPGMVARLSFGRGDLLILGGVAAWSVYTVLLKHRPKVHPFSFLAVTFTIGVATMLPLAGTEWLRLPRFAIGLPLVGVLAYVALLPSLVAYLLYNRAVAHIGAGRAGQMISLMPLFGALLAAIILGEPLAGYHWTAMGLIVAGLWISASGRSTRIQASSTSSAPQ